MKTLKWSLLVVLVIGVGVLTVMLHTRSTRPLVTDAEELDRSAAVSKTSRSTHEARVSSTIPDGGG